MSISTTKSQAILNITDFYYVAKQLDINFYLFDGTLIGAYRDGDFCVGDEDDIDVGILDKDYHRVSELVKVLESEYSFNCFKKVEHNGRIEGTAIKRGENHIDIIRINKHPDKEECWNLGRYFGKDSDKIAPGTKLAFVYPSVCFSDWDTIMFYGLYFKIPKFPGIFLTHRYGHWMEKISRPSFDWFTQSNSKNIRLDYEML